MSYVHDSSRVDDMLCIGRLHLNDLVKHDLMLKSFFQCSLDSVTNDAPLCSHYYSLPRFAQIYLDLGSQAFIWQEIGVANIVAWFGILSMPFTILPTPCCNAVKEFILTKQSVGNGVPTTAYIFHVIDFRKLSSDQGFF